MQVFDGEFGTSASFGKYCGVVGPPVIWSTTNVLTIQFKSDMYVGAKGFTAEYSFYDGMSYLACLAERPRVDKGCFWPHAQN